MPGLPFFKLPMLNQETILQQLGFSEIMKFCLTSEKAMQRAMHLVRLSFPEMIVVVRENRLELTLYSHRRTLSFTFKIVNNLKQKRPRNVTKTYEWTGFNGQRVKEYEKTEDTNGNKEFTYLVFPSRDFATAAREILRTVVRSSGESQICLTFYPRPTVLPLVNDFFKGLPLSKLEVLYSEANWTPLNVQIIHNIIADFNVTEQILISAKVLEGVQYDIGFTTPTVSIWKSQWVHVNAILNSTTSDFNFAFGPYPTAEFLKSILSHWISNQHMKDLIQISWSHWQDYGRKPNWPEGFEEMIQGLGEAVVDKESLSLEEKQKLDPSETAGKFIRRVDQRLAVVAFCEYEFYFRVIPN